MDAMPAVNERLALQAEYDKHLVIVIEECYNYMEAKVEAISSPNEMLCLIIDGMDQKTTMIPKFMQFVKGVEGRYVKTHLCGVLVYELALCTCGWMHITNTTVTRW